MARSTASPAVKAAAVARDKAATAFYGIKLQRTTDAELIERLDEMKQQPGGVQGYIKQLIRENIENSL